MFTNKSKDLKSQACGEAEVPQGTRPAGAVVATAAKVSIGKKNIMKTERETRKVVTFLNDNLKKITDDDSDFYNIEDKVGLNIKSDDGVSSIGGIIKNIIREQKINKILK